MGVPLLRLSGSFERIIGLYQSVESRPFCGGWGTVVFAPGARLLYLGDTAQKNLHVLKEELEDLNISFNVHDKMPDIVLYDEEKKWLFLIEAVTSHGPMSAKRVLELKKALSTCGAGLIFVSAFPDMKEFKRHVDAIAWDTEVWIADTPEHLMHFNGDRFLGPRKIV